jgi:hypothetical protein
VVAGLDVLLAQKLFELAIKGGDAPSPGASGAVEGSW